jgi:hypothetical protein
VVTVAFADDLMQMAAKIENAAGQRWRMGVEYQFRQNPGSPPPGYWMTPDQIRKYLGIQEAFQPWSLLPDPAAFQNVTDSLLRAMGLLRVDAEFSNPIDPSDQFGMARQEFQALVNDDPITNWSGATADNFRTRFLDHFKANTENQAIMIAVLKAAAEAQRAVWTNARNDITSIAQKTLASLHNSGCDQSAWVMTFSVLAGIASIAAVPLSGGSSLALGAAAIEGLSAATTVTAVGAVGSIMTNAIPAAAGDDSMSWSGHGVGGGIAAMKSAIAALQQRVDTAQLAIETSLIGNVLFIDTEKQTLFAMAKPTLSTDDTDFTPGR